ncbi:hypothetical protein LOD99_15944 [Oopsacas minuta]|uniref:Cadherin domain-containing protein n=1 Tax=Oopsacas minuta TaxID=111878 RepID=A0AAV7K8S2_9METZ|nr:hypothetical protein LOD99_15944 [Oopsacas minuta]
MSHQALSELHVIPQGQTINGEYYHRPPVDSIVDEEIVDAFIMLVSATDLDSGLNAMITYSVIPDTQFAMDATTGILTTKMALDREVLSSYSPRICATDGGSPSNQVCQLKTMEC